MYIVKTAKGFPYVQRENVEKKESVITESELPVWEVLE